MQSTKSNQGGGSTEIQDSFKTVPTGLFVKSDTCSVLLHIVQDVLRNRFKTAALTGPRRPDNTCEILLRALYPSGAHFVGSQDLLENYLTLIKESKPDIYVEKQMQVIDLADDDNETCILLDDTVDESVLVLEENTPGKDKVVNESVIVFEENMPAKDKADQLKKRSIGTGSGGWDVSVSSTQDDVLIIDSSNSKSSSSSKSTNNVETGSILKESNRPRKRKLPNEKEDERSVIEIVDDDVIVLDDSFSDSNNRVRMRHNDFNKSDSEWEVREIKNQKTVQRNDCNQRVSELKVTVTDKQRTVEQKPSSSTSSKRAGKLTYKRPAHLRHPLTQSSPADIPKAESNIYKAEVVEKRTGLRPIVIDGNNVGVSHGKGQFSLKGVQICINYFEKRGHRHIKAFLPHYRINKNTFEELRKMERQGTVVLTPSRKVDGRTMASYDDRYIVQYAYEMGGVIVSTDNYRDLQEENPAWKDTINTRLLMFTWVDDLLMFPQDPLGRKGPSLDSLLKFPDPS